MIPLPKGSQSIGQDYLDFAADGFRISPERQARFDAMDREITEWLLSASRTDKRYAEIFRQYVETVVFDPANHLPTA